jgi:hypothetical protein
VISEEAVIAILSSEGRAPLEFCFLLGDVIFRWHPSLPLWGGFLFDDRELAEACRSFLRNEGRHFKNREEVRAWAREQGWPRWEELRIDNVP